MWPEAKYQQGLELIKQGINDCEIGRRLGIPRGTVKSWRCGWMTTSGGRTESWSGRKVTCFRCNGDLVGEEAYAYLLGVYLGDGWIRTGSRNVYQLRITCDLRYPEIIDEIATHIVILRGADKVGFASRKGAWMSMPTGSTGLASSRSTAQGENMNVRSSLLPGSNQSLPLT